MFRDQGKGWLDGAVLGPRRSCSASSARTARDRLLLVNLGSDLALEPVPEPLLAPLTASGWEVLWSSEDPRYGGSGAPSPEDEEGCWRLPGQAAVVMRLVERKKEKR